jgi:hypothetical protein
MEAKDDWDFNSSNMEDPNANEREWVMGFHTSTIIMSFTFLKQLVGEFWGKSWT